MEITIIKRLNQHWLYVALLAFAILLINGNESIAKVRGFTKEEISKNILSESPVKQIKKGFRKGYGINSYLTISPDGKWLAVQSRGGNELVIISTDTHKSRRIPLENPMLTYARVIGKHVIISRSFKSSIFYSYDLSDAKAKWKKLKLNTIKDIKNRDLSLYFPVMSHKKRSVTKIILFDPKKEQGYVYTLLTDFPRTIISTSLDKDQKTFYLSKQGGGIFALDNRPNSNPRSILTESFNPSIGKSKLVENFLLFNTPATSNIYAYNLKSKTKHYAVRCYDRVICFYPLFHPKDNRFYFIAEIEDEATGVFEGRFDPSLNRLEAPKAPGIWWGCIENVDSDNSAVTFQFEDRKDESFEFNRREEIIVTWESLMSSPEVNVILSTMGIDRYVKADSIKLKGRKVKEGGKVCTKENTVYFENDKFHRGNFKKPAVAKNTLFFKAYHYRLRLY